MIRLLLIAILLNGVSFAQVVKPQRYQIIKPSDEYRVLDVGQILLDTETGRTWLRGKCSENLNSICWFPMTFRLGAFPWKWEESTKKMEDSGKILDNPPKGKFDDLYFGEKTP